MLREKNFLPCLVFAHPALAVSSVMAKKIRASRSRRVEEANGQARFTYRANVEGHGFLGPLSPRMGPILRRRFLGDLRHVKALLEAASPTVIS